MVWLLDYTLTKNMISRNFMKTFNTQIISVESQALKHTMNTIQHYVAIACGASLTNPANMVPLFMKTPHRVAVNNKQMYRRLY